MNILKKERVKIILCLLVAFLLILVPQYFTPVSSDDFIYVANNSDWSNLVWRYMHWSGRLVADAGSLILLQLPKVVYALIKTCIWVGLVVLISQLPTIINQKYEWKSSNFFVVFLLYWIANPNLGQTSFWTVGFTNYLLTNFFIVSYLFVIFYLKDKKLHISSILTIILLGLLAGNSNENTSIIVVLLTAVFLVIEKNKKVFIVGLPPTVIGMLVLLLSPGQHARLQNPAFQLAREQSIVHRLWEYFSSNWFIDTFKSFSWIFVTFILISFIYLFKKQVPQKTNMTYSLIFFFAAVFANAAFGGSYGFPVAIRSLNGALIFFLISIAFFIKDLTYSEKPFYKKSIMYLLLLLLLPFSLTYFYATKSVVSLKGQFQIRELAILEGIKNKEEQIYIPNYYVGKLYNPSDSIDLYQGDMNAYYGKGDSPLKITTFSKDFSFDYSNSQLVNEKQIPLNINFGQKVHLKAINIFPDERVSGQYSVNATFDNSLLTEYNPDEFLLFIHVNWAREGQEATSMFNADTSLNNQLSIDGKYIFSSPIGNVRPRDIKSIDIGIYNRKTKTNEVATRIELKQ